MRCLLRQAVHNKSHQLSPEGKSANIPLYIIFLNMYLFSTNYREHDLEQIQVTLYNHCLQNLQTSTSRCEQLAARRMVGTRRHKPVSTLWPFNTLLSCKNKLFSRFYISYGNKNCHTETVIRNSGSVIKHSIIYKNGLVVAANKFKRYTSSLP